MKDARGFRQGRIESVAALAGQVGVGVPKGRGLSAAIVNPESPCDLILPVDLDRDFDGVAFRH
jgi:hypothetical protein